MTNFNTQARRVRNPALPPIARGGSLRACARLYGEMTGTSYNAILNLLDARFGVIHAPIPEEDGLIAAIDALEISRNRILEIRRRFATMRLRQKMRGIRSARRRDVEAMQEQCRTVGL